MAFLTDYSYRQLIERVEIKNLDRIDQQFFKKNIYDNDYLYYFFNQLDLKKLFAEKIILSDDNTFVLVHKEVAERKDNTTYVLEIKGKVKYHKDNQCVALNRGFKNFYMPEPIAILAIEDSVKHEKIVGEIRQWFEKNNYTVQRYEAGEINDKILTADFNNTFPKKFDIEPILISQSDKSQFQWYIEKKSKGNVGIEESFDHNEFIIKIAELLKKRDFICNSRTMQSLSKYDFLVIRDNVDILNYINESLYKGYLRNVSDVFIDNYGIERLKEFWSKHRELKIDAFNLLSVYFKWTYNFKEKTFDEIYLEDFNLKACNLCYARN
ncbi:MAG: hypothetical protein JKY08_05845 [Flavobacteriaceae bacterium]|nr:hypothetical protein [Flavobacteriaceae bacterium]